MPRRIQLRFVHLALVAAALLTVGGCQKTAKGTPPAQPGAQAAAASQVTAPGQPPAAPPATTPATPPPPLPEPEPSNPQPKGDAWVYTPRLSHHIGEPLEVRYRTSDPRPGKAWIGLIPADVKETDAATNVRTAAGTTDTVDAKEATLNIPLEQSGSFHLRFFDGKDTEAKLLDESPLIKVMQWPMGDRTRQSPPYITIGATGTGSKIEVQEGFPVVGYYEVPGGYPSKAWIAIVPASIKSPLEKDSDGKDVKWQYVGTQLKGQFTWMSDKQGTYVFRIFPSNLPNCDYVAQSEEFTIIPASGKAAKH